MLTAAVLLSFALVASAAPTTTHDTITSVPLQRNTHTKGNRTTTWAYNQAVHLKNKYKPGKSLRRRQNADGLGAQGLVNINADSSYVASLVVGTPPTPYTVILDTGSSDMWLAGTNCALCTRVPRFDEQQSSTFSSLNSSFEIKYGSGAAAGSLGVDVVQMAGFEVPNQAFAVVDQVTKGLLDNGISGLLGLGFGTIASSGATPFAQTLFEQNALQDPLFSFFLTRFLDVLHTNDNIAQFGGEFMLGATNKQLYTGDIDFVDIPRGREGFWGLELTTLLVNGNEVNVPVAENFAAIDTGTTLVGGPSDVIAALYAQVPGAVPATGQLEGFWVYPCDAPFSIQLGFGPKGQHTVWPISTNDLELMRVSDTECVGAFFEIELGGSSDNPTFIVGDTFLKNVYNVYRFDPPSVGFAKLSNFAESHNGIIDETLPTPTVVDSPIRATATLAINGGSSVGDDSGMYGSVNSSAPRLLGVSTWTVTAVVVFGMLRVWF